MSIRAINLTNLGLPVSAALWLGRMPENTSQLAAMISEIKCQSVNRLLVLVTGKELVEIAPTAYATWLGANCPLPLTRFPIPDHGIATDNRHFKSMLTEQIHHLQCGCRTLLHCRAGIGRSALVASCLLIEMGLPIESAINRVDLAGSHPETDLQRQFILDYGRS